MTLAIFDLDHTLLQGDSDYLWGEYMVANNITDQAEYQYRNQSFIEDYRQGRLDSDQYLKFALAPLTRHRLEDLHRWREDYLQTWIKPIIAPGTPALLQLHRQQGDTLIAISSTHRFITGPIASMLGIPNILATEPEIINNRYTGNYLGIPTYQQGKVTALTKWLNATNNNLEGSHFYSDSINDLALLEHVSHPVAVHPDEALARIASARKWPIIDLGLQNR